MLTILFFYDRLHVDHTFFYDRLHVKHDDPIWSENMTLKINGSGHVIHAFVNGEHIGRILEPYVKLRLYLYKSFNEFLPVF